MTETFPFFLILFAGILFSTLFRKVHIPWVVSLIVAGIAIGPFGFEFIEINDTALFIGNIGLVFLMFMAGLETKISSFKGFKKGLLKLSFINGALPFVVGIGIGYFFGYSIITSLLLGIIFISSSIAVVIPTLEKNGLIETNLGHSVVITSVIQDIVSLILLSILLQSIDPVTSLPLFIFYPILILVLILFRFLLPKLIKFVLYISHESTGLYEQNFRIVFLFLLGTVLTFELLGLHPIIAAFFAGLVLSETIQSKTLIHKIHTISYGIFIPTFFIIIGAQTNLGILFELDKAIWLVLVVVFGSVLSKFISGWIGGKLVGFDSNQSLLFAISSIPQLSTTLAVVATATTLDLIDTKMQAAMIILSIVTVLVSPTLMNIFAEKIKRSIKKTSSE
jgi:Kef-type K+ transport system membrane component KefB